MTAMRFVRKSQQPSPSPSSFIIAFGVLGKPPALPSAAVSQAKRYPHLLLLPSSLISYKDDDEPRPRGIPIVHLAVVLLPPAAAFNALLAVKKQLLDPSNHLRNWNKGDPCTSNWTGIECSDHPGNDGYLHVEELQLQNMNLSGTLARELGQLSHLKILDFMWNQMIGSIPKEIGNISTLELLLLNGNNLTGSLPDELSYLSNMNRFQIDQNNISGQIPKAYANLSSVRHLHFNNNSLSGQIPPELSRTSSCFTSDNNNFNDLIFQLLMRTFHISKVVSANKPYS
ncbi:hypothetical protein GQ457_01G035810 [Hibiscus cannabinus]